MELVECPDDWKMGWIDRRDALTPGGQRPSEHVDTVAVDGEHADDLAKTERHDRDVVTAQAQRRQADKRPGNRCQDNGGDQDQGEVEVHPGELVCELRDADMDVAVKEEAGPQPARRVGADREERDISKVEQPCEAHDHVQPERHHHIGQRDHRCVQKAAGLGQPEWQYEGDHDQAGDAGAAPPGRQPLEQRCSPIQELCGEFAHPASRVSSPISPRGRSVMIKIR